LLCAFSLGSVLLGIFAAYLFFIIYAFGDLFFFVTYYRRLLALPALTSRRSARWIVAITPIACFVSVLAVLRNLADLEVRDSLALQAGFLIAWGAVMIWVHVIGSLIGLNLLEHGLEGRNSAAVCAGVGLMLGATLATAGANIGQGPTVEPTLGPMFLAVGGLTILWATFSMVTGCVAAVTVDRDLPSGLRMAALSVAWGLILGRSVAGDWVSVEATLRDFLQQGLMTAALLLGIATGVEFLEQPTKRRPFPSLARSGVCPAMLFLAFALGWLWHLGPGF
jgi:hypothetical protein